MRKPPLFIVVVIYQRDSSSAEEATSALRHFISESEYRHPVTHEMMSLETLRTIDDFWKWHHMLIMPHHSSGTPVFLVAARRQLRHVPILLNSF